MLPESQGDVIMRTGTTVAIAVLLLLIVGALVVQLMAVRVG